MTSGLIAGTGELLSGERARDHLDRLGHPDQVGPGVTAQDGKGQPAGPGDVTVRHTGVAVLLNLEGDGPAGLARITEAMQRADAGVAAPAEDELAGTPRTDQLVVDDIGGHPYQGQVAPALPDDLLAGGERDQVREALEGHGVTVMDEGGYGVSQRHQGRHAYYRLVCALSELLYI